jgi:hypothetical protein
MWDGSAIGVRPSFLITAVTVAPPSVTCVDTTVRSVATGGVGENDATEYDDGGDNQGWYGVLHASPTA